MPGMPQQQGPNIAQLLQLLMSQGAGQGRAGQPLANAAPQFPNLPTPQVNPAQVIFPGILGPQQQQQGQGGGGKGGSGGKGGGDILSSLMGGKGGSSAIPASLAGYGGLDTVGSADAIAALAGGFG